MTSVSPGGASTINGVQYQMLWSLLRAVKLHVEDADPDEQTGQLTCARLILEPLGGGGDLQEIGKATRVVEQLKARSDGGAWSLREVVEDVLPDLYLSVAEQVPDTEFRFVTEGRMGDWHGVYDFFRSLRSRTYPAADVLAGLDDTQELKFGRASRQGSSDSKPFWSEATYTERTLFVRIVEEVRRRKRVEKEPLETTRQNLWHLLDRFTFVDHQTASLLQEQIDSLLLTVMGSKTLLAEKRDAMLTGLARRAKQGGAEIVAAEFLAEYGLNVVPFTKWMHFVQRGREQLHWELQRRGYRPSDDVRRDAARMLSSLWTDDTPMIALSGETGRGKSWSLGALALAVGETDVAVLVSATGDARQDITAAAQVFWEEIAQRDEALSLSRTSVRLRELAPAEAHRWLFLFVDGVQDPAEARALAQHPWEKWGVRLAISCPPEIARTFNQAGQGRVAVHEIEDFTPEEMQEYLTSRAGLDWRDIPTDLLSTLRRPLLARLYREVVGRTGWVPKNEYELYARYWQRLDEDEQAHHPLDKVALRRLARSLLNEAPYPWLGEQLLEAGLDNAAIARLIRAGWLRAAPQGRYEVWHDRLLNWAVAEGLVAARLVGEMASEEFCAIIGQLCWSERTYQGRALGYAAMDAVWLLAAPELEQSDLLDQLLAVLERPEWRGHEILYKRLLPTIGPGIVPALFRRLQTASGREHWERRGSLTRALRSLCDAGHTPQALHLLDSPDRDVQRAGLRLLAGSPSADALDRLWTLHGDIYANPERYHDPEEGSFTGLADMESFRALSSCAKKNPVWLEETILRADPVREPVHDLAHWLANLDGEKPRWLRCKSVLFAKVGADHERALARNIHKHRDVDEIEWLRERISRPDDLVGAVAMRALISLDFAAALEELARLPVDELVSTRKWCFGALLARQPEVALARLYEILRRREDPWDAAMVFDGHENAMTGAVLDLVLDALEPLLDAEADDPAPQKNRMYRPLKLLSGVHRLELLDCFRQRRGTALENKLAAWVLRRNGYRGYWAEPDLDAAVQLLFNMGGDGFTQAVNCFVNSDNHYDRLNGLDLAAKRPDDQTVRLLGDISLRDKLNDGFPHEQYKATLALARLGHWQGVVVSLLKWGLDVSHDIVEGRLGAEPLDDLTIAPALEALEDVSQRDSTQMPGAVLAVGLGRRSEQRDRILSVLEASSSGSPVSRACVITLGLLDDPEGRTVPPLARQLDVPACQHEAISALLRNGSDAALDALLDHLQRVFLWEIAVNLLHFSRTVEATCRLVRDQLHRLAAASDGNPTNRLTFSDTLTKFLLYVEDEAVLAPILGESEVRAYLHDEAFTDEKITQYAGERAAIIKSLATFDKDEAFQAACRAMRNPATHDRPALPYLLLELDAVRAVPFLIDRAEKETATKVIRAIGHAFAEHDLSDVILAQMKDENASKRRSACRLAGSQRPSTSLIAAVYGCLSDDTESVGEAARQALSHLRYSAEAEKLLEAYLEEPEMSHRWILLDAFVALVDPGDLHRPWPQWVRRISEGMSNFMQRYTTERLNGRRSKLAEEAEAQDNWAASSDD